MAEIANLNTKLSLESASFLSGVEKSRGALRSLISSLDPVAAATARYNRQVQLLEGGLKRGALTADQHGLALQRLTSRYNEQVRNQTALTSSSGQMRAGMQQLSFQLGDVSQQFAMGTRPMVIFAQQGGQVIQAIQMMSTNAKGFVGFLAGPWGQVITAAILLVSAFSDKLFGNAEAAKAAELANDGLSDAQSVLGKMFDLTSGKLQHQNDLLKLNAQLTALNLKTEAEAARARASSAASGARPSVGSFMAAELGAVGESRAAAGRISNTINQVLAGKLDASKAFGSISPTDFAQTNVTPQAFNAALKDAVEARVKGATAAEIDKTLSTGVLSSVFRQEGHTKRTPKGPADRSDQRAERADDQMARLLDEQANLQLAMTADLRHRARIQHQQVDAELEAYKVDIAHQVAQKEITAEKGKELLDQKARNAELENGRINRDLDNALAREETDLAQSRVNIALSLKDGELDNARTQADRRRIQLEMLDAETQQLKYAIQQQLLSRDLSDATRERLENQLKQVDADASTKRGRIERDTMGPLAEYLDRLPKTAEEANEAFQRIAADGLQSLNDGIAEGITGAKSLGAAFSDVTRQIIADLARIGIQKFITGPLANALFGGGKLFGGGLGGTPAAVAGATDFTPIATDFSSFSLPKFASGGSMQIGGFPGIDKNLLSLNGHPVARVSQGETLNISPYGAMTSGKIQVEVVANNNGFGAVVRNHAGHVVAEAAPALIDGGGRAGVARFKYQQSRQV